MKTLRAYRYRLYPNASQERRLAETLETCRRTYNRALGLRIEAWRERKESISAYELRRRVLADRTEFQKAVYAQVLGDAVLRLDKTYQAFWKARQAGRAHGFPRFKSIFRYDSFCYPQAGHGFKITGDRLHLTKIGDVRIVLHRPLPDGAKVKTCTIRREVDQWYACFSCEIEPEFACCESPDAVIGVDLGIEHFAVLSSGEEIENPKHFRRAELRLKLLQRRLSRKRKGSTNRAKARLAVARVHRKVRRQRTDFLAKTARALVMRFGTVVFEDLNVRGMVRNHCLAKSIADAGWSGLVQKARSLVESTGGRVVLVDPRFTSQVCSGCGRREPKALSERLHSCPDCGLTLTRDHNAAINIREAGMVSLNASGPRVSREGGDNTPSLLPCGLKEEAPKLAWG